MSGNPAYGGLLNPREIASAEFSDFLADGTHRKVSRTAIATFRSLSQAAPWLPGAADEIYVARTDATARTMQNETELIDLLQRQGVRIIVPGFESRWMICVTRPVRKKSSA